MRVDAIEQGAGDACLIVGGASWRPAPSQRGIAEMAAAAGVHGGDQVDAGGKRHVSVRPGDADIAGFERLAEGVEHLPLELGQFVEQQNAKMREAEARASRPS